MNIDTQLLFFFSALGAFNGVLLSVYFLFFARPKHLSNYFLGGLLAMLSMRIGKSVIFYFNPALAKIYLQFGLYACFMIGPFFFFFFLSNTHHPPLRLYWKFWLPALFITIASFGYFYPYETNGYIWREFVYRSINYQWLFFIGLSAYTLRPTFKTVFVYKKPLDYATTWMLSVFFGVSLIWLAYFTSRYTSYIVGALSFSFVTYLLVFLLVARRRKKEITPDENKAKYANRKIDLAEAKLLLQKIEKLMSVEELYKNSNLTLSILAKELNVSTHFLSQLLNDNFQKRFTQFINEYRIEEAKQQLRSDTPLKMEALAEHCGFNSTSTFYSAFKKNTKTTPARYMEENKSLSTNKP
ncbi:MAG: helix-turn-helix domain-containing protein [Saprospiraceae bacterium]